MYQCSSEAHLPIVEGPATVGALGRGLRGHPDKAGPHGGAGGHHAGPLGARCRVPLSHHAQEHYDRGGEPHDDGQPHTVSFLLFKHALNAPGPACKGLS